MTDPQPGTAVVPADDRATGSKLLDMARTPEERAFAFEKMTQLHQSKLIRTAAQQIAATAWGKECSAEGRHAIARYAYEMGTDPARHWLVMGGKLYDSAELWYDLATSQPDYIGHDGQHINDDERLLDEERVRRQQLRAKHNIPEGVAGAYECTIYKRMEDGSVKEFTRANHAGNRQGFVAKLGRDGEIKDPIGQQDPGKTAETRAFRRAAKTAWPIWRFKRDIPEGEGLNVAELARAEVDDMLATEKVEAAKATGLMDGVKRMLDVPGAEGLQIRSNEGDRLPAESTKHIERGITGGTEPAAPVEGVRAAGGDPYDEDDIRREDEELAKD